ncbi:MAG TPA: class I SAM-dependent methyltransferase [Chryseolinea sp.]|nr:class I SAM-dependent methyltransferase [Chryseolinea sp.]
MNSFDRFDACLLCSSPSLQALTGYEKDYLVKCSSCSFVFCQRKPTTDELKAHYALYPRANTISEITLKRYDELLNAFEPYRKTNNIIDVGCGDGFFLEAAKKREWNVFGTEFTPEAIEVCERKGIQMTMSPLNPNYYNPDFFDVITSFEVIEHINTPNQELNSFSSILRNGGLVYVTTPNFNSISRNILKSKWNMIQYPEHLSYYTVPTLSSLFRKNNFKKINISTTGISINRLRASSHSENSKVQSVNVDEALRQKTEDRIIFRVIKTSLNTMLNITQKGDALKAFFQKQ